MEGYNSVGKNNVCIFLTKSICMKKSENYLSRKLKEHLILNVKQLNAFNYWTELEYSKNSNSCHSKRNKHLFQIESVQSFSIKAKIFQKWLELYFSQRNRGKWHTQPHPQCIFCYKRKAKKRPWKTFTATSLDV